MPTQLPAPSPRKIDKSRRGAPRRPTDLAGLLHGRSPRAVTVVDLSLTGCLVRGDAERLVQYRQRTPFKKQQDIQSQLPAMTPQDLQGVDVMSRYFDVRGRLRLSDRVLEQRSLIERNQRLITVLSSERISSNDSGR